MDHQYSQYFDFCFSGSNQAQNNGSSSSTSGLGLSNLPQLLTAAGAQGQILAVGPQVRITVSSPGDLDSDVNAHLLHQKPYKFYM